MKIPLKRETLERLWEKYRLVLLIILGGLLLMSLPGNQDKEKADEMKESEYFSLEETERQMEELLGHIEGTGKLRLMLTLKSGSQLYLAEDSDEASESGTTERQRETVTLNRGSGYEDVVITREIYPIYQGAVVVCQGADQAKVRLAVIEAVAALTGLSSDRITVVKWNS